jgi:putative glutamine amidotransferase
VSARVRIGLVACDRNHDYLQALGRTGVDVVVVDATDPAWLDTLGEVNGVCLPGGHDVDPARYGEPPHEALERAHPLRDAVELELARRAAARDVPLLAICRGLQVLNVALVGTLVQHIPDQVPGAHPHAVTDTPTTVAHEVTVNDDSWLGRAVRSGMATAVNSRHHQAIRALAPTLRTTAVAPDGIVEGVELPDATFCVGVQWHPENFWRTGQSHALFALFADAARTANRRLTER